MTDNQMKKLGWKWTPGKRGRFLIESSKAKKKRVLLEIKAENKKLKGLL